MTLRGWDARKLAEKTGMRAERVAQIVEGHTFQGYPIGEPTASDVRDLARALQLSPDILMAENNVENRAKVNLRW
jgi:transcriptional regulator with XRE-family HTH domain